MNKSNLTKTVRKELGLSLQRAEEMVDMMFGKLSQARVDGDRIEIRGVGSFRIREYDSYTARNPRTGTC